MADIKLFMTLSGTIKQVVLHPPLGSGNEELYHIMVNGFYKGRIWKTEHFGWQNDVKPPFKKDDIEMLIKAVSI